MAGADDNVQSVLERVAATVAESGRKLSERQHIADAVRELQACKVNLQRIAASVATNTFVTINSAIDDMLCLAHQSQQANDVTVNAPLSLPSTAPLPQGLLLSFCYKLTVPLPVAITTACSPIECSISNTVHNFQHYLHASVTYEVVLVTWNFPHISSAYF